MSQHLRSAMAVVFLTLAAGSVAPGGVAPAYADARAAMVPAPAAPLVAVAGRGERRFPTEAAAAGRGPQRGLRCRQEMAADRGMLFDRGGTRQPSLWMENTPGPLDLIFIGEDGKVR